jgi:protein-S-isoprenylcysteine O-methyltransferase Ste14
MNTSRSTPRVRAMALALLTCTVLVALAARPWLGSGGFASAACGLAGLMLVAVAALGRLWTSLFIAGFKDDTLVQSGPYAACRHPLYLLSLVAMLGLGLTTRSVTLLVALLAVAALLHLSALRSEDAALVGRHGEVARRYQSTVPALWPDWSRYAVPEVATIRPRVVWKAVLDAGTLLLAYTLLQFAHTLQVAGVTPALLQLP